MYNAFSYKSDFIPILSIPIANKDKSIEPSNALKNPSTSNPGAIQPANIKSKALMTSAKSPNVRMVSGKDINCSTGFMNVLIRARITQTNLINLSKE